MLKMNELFQSMEMGKRQTKDKAEKDREPER
jgi:hypothetical protein